MALPILDGNQTSTTLATTVSGGAHYPNHIIASGTVTANVNGSIIGEGYNSLYDLINDGSLIVNSIANPVTIGSIPAISGTVTANDFSEWQEISTRYWKADQSDWIINVSQYSAIRLYIDGDNTASISNGFWIRDAGDTYCEQDYIIWNGRSSVNSFPLADCTPVLDANVHYNYVKFTGSEPMSGATTILYGKKTRILDGLTNYQLRQSPIEVSGTVTASVSNSVTVGSLPAISGTVTANIANSITVGSLPVQLSTTTIGGTARLNVTLSSATTVGATAPSYANLYGGSDGTNLRAISVDSSGRTVVTGSTSILGTPSVTMGAISGTVTASIASTTVTISALPSGTLTTRFGSVTTANLAQISTAVTNNSRKYLLIQNITTASNAITIGVGFTPTTTQGIQLVAGAGITFESSYIPTGAVYVLSSVTASAFTILEA